MVFKIGIKTLFGSFDWYTFRPPIHRPRLFISSKRISQFIKQMHGRGQRETQRGGGEVGGQEVKARWERVPTKGEERLKLTGFLK